ncbi:MAG: T9SS type A sorting domain-containing protein [Cyclobacteriaceae bacterium]|nr:T9SS type A sorting domain-containing protein [Cyclobacteriaceae bacterium]
MAETLLLTGVLDAQESGNTVEYNGNAAQTLKVSLNNLYGNLVIAGSSIKSLGGLTKVQNNITLSSTLAIGTQLLELAGNFTNTGVLTSTGAGQITFNGTGDQTITSNTTIVVRNVRINKPAGVLTLTNTNLNVSAALTLTIGNIVTGTNKVIVGTGTGVGLLGTISSTGNSFIEGRLERYISNASGNNNSAALSFPISNNGATRTATLTLIGTAGTINGSLTLNFLPTNPGNTGMPLDDAGTSLFNTFFEGYWQLTPANGLTSNNINVELNGQGFTSYSLATARLVTRPSGTTPWTLSGTHVASSGSIAQRNGIGYVAAEIAFADVNNCDQPNTNSITGNTSVCINTNNEDYTAVGGLTGSTYTWNVTGGTIIGYNAGGGNVTVSARTSITGVGYQTVRINWGATGGAGTISVSENNNFSPVFGCGAGSPVVTNVTIHPLPTSVISGNTTASPGEVDAAFTVIANAGYTYSWSVVGGTIDGGTGTGTVPDPSIRSGASLNAITIDWGTTPGNYTVQVTATNNTPCANVSAAIVSLPVTIINEITSTGNSVNWSQASTWSANRVPTAFDNVRILAGHRVSVNIDNAAVNNFVVAAGADFEIEDQREITVNGNLRVDGDIEFFDGGNIETLGIIMAGDGKEFSGTGRIFTQTSINTGQTNPHVVFNGNTTIAAGTNIEIFSTDNDYSNIVRIETDKVVTNFGRVSINKSLVGGGAASQWVNKAGSQLLVSEVLMLTGILDASEADNLVVYNGSVAQSIKQTLLSYANLQLAGASTKSLSGNTIVTGNLTISSGLDLNLFNLLLGGNWTNTGAFTPGSTRVTFNGSTDQSVSNSTGETFGRVTIDKPAGSLTLLNNVTATNDLVFIKGNVVTGANKFTLGTSSAEGTLDLSLYTSGAFIGKFERFVDTSAPHQFVFPVGTTTSYRPVTVDFTTISTSGAIITEFVSSAPGSNGLPVDESPAAYLVRNAFTEGYWNITSPAPNAISFTELDVDLTATNFTSFTIDAATRVLSRVNASSPWLLNGVHVAATGNIAQRDNLASLPLDIALGDDTNCVTPTTSAITRVSGTDCINTSSVYQVTNTPASTYTWSVTGGTITAGQGSNQVTILWASNGGTYDLTVTENNSGGGGCGLGTPVTLSVGVNPVPLSAIFGPVEVAANSNGIAYSVSNIAGYTYDWTVVGGTRVGTGNAITVNWGTAGNGSVSVFGTFTACGVVTETQTINVDIYPTIQSNNTGGGNWSNAGTWFPSVVPQASNSVVIRGTDIVNVNIDNALINNLTVDAAARLIINDQREISASGNVTINGVVEFQDGGNIESLGLVMIGANTILSGTGQIITNAAINGGQTNTMLRFNANVTIASGTNLTVSATDIDYNDLVTIEAGRIVNNEGTFTVTRNLVGANATSSRWNNATGGTLIIGGTLLATGRLDASQAGNTVTYNGNVNQNVKAPLSTYSSLSFAGSNQKLLLSNTIVTENLTIAGTADFRLNSRNLTVGGNFTRTGTFTPGTNSVTLNGTSDQTITTASNFHTLIINKLSGNVVLSGDASVSNVLTMTQGNIISGSNKITLGTSAPAIGTLNYTAGRIIGRFERWLATANTNTSLRFPVGTTIDDLPFFISFDNLSTGGSLTVTFNTTDPGYGNLPITESSTTIFHAFDEGFWDVTNNGITTTSYDVDVTANNFDSYIFDAVGANRILARADGTSNWNSPIPGVHVAGSGAVVSRDNINLTLNAEFAVGAIEDCPAINTSIITGNTSVCSNTTTEVYSVANVAGSTYTWTVAGATFTGQGTNSITITNWGSGGVKTVSVIESNACETGIAQNLSVDVHPILYGTVSGNTSVIPFATGETYSVPFRTGYCYQWNITSGSGTIVSTSANGSSVVINWGNVSSTLQVVVKYVGGGTCADPAACAGTTETINIPITITSVFTSTATGGNWNAPATWLCNCVPPNNANIEIRTTGVNEVILTNNNVIVGNVDIGVGARLNNNGFLLTVNGDYLLNGTHSGNGNTIITGSTSGTWSGNGAKTGGSLTFSQPRTITSGTMTIAGDVLLNPNVTLTNNGDVTLQGNLQGANNTNSIWTNGAGSKLTIEGTFNSGRINAGASNNTVEYVANSAQNIRLPIGSPGSYFNLVVSGNATKTLTGDAQIQNLIIDPSNTESTVFDAGAFTLTVNGDITNNQTLTSTGTVIIAGTAASQSILGNPVSNSFTNLQVNKPAGTTFNYNPSAASISTSLNVVSGTFRLSSAGNLSLSGNVSIGTSGTLDATNIGTLTTGGNFTKTGSGVFTPGSSTLIFNAGVARTVSGANLTFFNLEKTGGSTLTFTGGNKTISNSLLLSGGNIVTSSSSLLILADNATVTPDGGSASAFVSGPVRKIGNDYPFVFPIGKGSRWSRLAISSPNGTLNASDAFTAEYFTNPAPNPSSVSNAVRVSGREYWDITRNIGNAQPRVTFHWEDGTFSQITQLSSLLGMHYNSSTSQWENMCPCVTTGSATSGTITTGNFTSFSPATFGSSSFSENPLPVVLLSFTAKENAGLVNLFWQTATEINADGYEIEYAADGENFIMIGNVKAAGNSNSLLNYTFNHTTPAQGKNYYRLKMLDLDGTFEYSEVRLVEVLNAKPAIAIQVVPNPVINRNMVIQVDTNLNGIDAQIRIIDMQGRVVLIEDFAASDFSNRIELKTENKLSAGMYIVEVSIGLKSAQTRAVIMN